MDYTLFFSFIIPVYNAASTLNRCLDSILVRTTPDYEIILINDSSTDNSLEICEEYAAKYSQVSVYTFPNGGAGAARNRGLEKAQGQYILFCDSDDWYNSEELNKLLDSADEQMKDIDLLCFDYRRQWVDYFEDIKHFDNETFELKDKEERLFAVSSSMLSKKFGIILWNKIYKREIIEKQQIIFPERDILNNKHDWGEDLCFNIQYVLYCHSIRSVDSAIYINTLRVKKGEMDTTYFPRNKIDHMSKMIGSVSESNIYQTGYSEKDFYLIYVWQMYNYIVGLARISGIKECRDQFFDLNNKRYIFLLFGKAVFHWKKYSSVRWIKNNRKDYFALILYILTGNTVLYKFICKYL